MQKVYSGLDGLDVSFQGHMPPSFLHCLARAKEEARESKKAVTLSYKGFEFNVRGTGASGYSYIVDTGPDGEVWFFANSSKRDGWNMRVSVSSMGLALYGYAAIKERLWDRLEHFGAWVLDHSVARVDFATDFVAPGFEPKAENVIAHWRMTQSEFCDTGEEGDGGGFHIVKQSGRVNSLTIGRMPGRQVIIYNKRREVIDRRKVHWWSIWGIEDRKTPVWRIEVRAGKRELKDRWKISTLESLEAMLPDILRGILTDIRLVQDEQTDSNVTRQALHPCWMMAQGAAERPLGEDLERPEPQPIIAETQAAMKERYMSLAAGLTASLSVIQGIEGCEMPKAVGEALTASIANHISRNKSKFMDSQKRAKKRLRFVTDASAWGMPLGA